LDLLDRFGVKSTFFIPDHSAVAFPEPTRMIRACGHEIGHHGWVHENPAMLTPEQERHVLERGLEALDRIAGVRPVGYRSPAWDNSPVTVSLLLEYGFEYESSLMGGDYAPYWCRVGDALFLARDRHNQVSVGSLGNFRGARQEGAPTYRGNKTRTCRSAPLTGQRR
jgi:peptidoglycan/xylan/chitin deacetylase (PgdA/CDA1 family)